MELITEYDPSCLEPENLVKTCRIQKVSVWIYQKSWEAVKTGEAMFQENGEVLNKWVDLYRHSEKNLLILNLENGDKIWALQRDRDTSRDFPGI